MTGGAFGRVAAASAMGLALAAGLAGCTGDTQAERAADQLPDLTVEGLEQVDCDQFSAQNLDPIEDPYVRECWTGSPETPFAQEADAIIGIIESSTDSEDVTDYICPDDILIDSVAYACRAAYDDEVMYRVVVSLPDPESIVSALPDAPTEDEIEEAVSGAPVQVVVQTEKTPEE
ncbi:hypothetical protein [Demequina sp. NBRC 110057]|uniref:hypothetical protein n=1 Tax=Demequina sp. NBRC 110057 TaxID=1570346 RepID=UPI000A01C879|nr:hypothetical protein [Demequina sp. NBRC 110057]